MSYTDLAFLAAFAFPIGLGLGYVGGGRSEARYWANHADNGDVFHKGTFYRVTKKIGQRPRARAEGRSE